MPDLDDPQRLCSLFELVRDAREDGLLLAYHDRSDGGAFAALCEMAFASHMGLDIQLDGWGDGREGDVFRTLFNEELGVIVQVPVEDRATFADLVARHGLIDCAQRIARPTSANMIRVSQEDNVLAEWRWEELFDAWWSVSHALQRLRDNPECADQERHATRRYDAPPLTPLADVRCRRRRRGAFHLDRRTTKGRDPARAGRQQPDRNRGRVRSRRFRRL